MSSYFIGNVLPDTNQAGENDPTFDFKKEEASSLRLKGIPIRIEHNEKLQVGTVTRDWSTKDGKKWVIGRLDHSTLDGNYADKCIRPSKKSGHTLYTGLSLKHAYRRYSDGRSEKAPLEVSLCTKPRRANCKIYKTSKPKTKKNDYIVHTASSKSMSSETPQQTTESVTETAPSTKAPAEAPATEAPVEQTPAVEEAPSTDVPATEELMQMVVNQENDLLQAKKQAEEATEELKAVQEKLAALEAEKKAAEESKEMEIKTKAENLGAALADSLRKNVDVSEDVQAAINTLAKGNPTEASKVFEIMHCASAKYEKRLTETTKASLAKQCRDIVSRKRSAAPVQEVVHAASKKQKPNPFASSFGSSSSSSSSIRERNPQLFEAFSRISRSGTGLMHEIAQIGRV